MRWVVDASVAIKWYIPEDHEAEAARLRESAGEFHAPELIVPEFSNVIWQKIRRGEISQLEGEQIVSAFVRSDIRLHSQHRFARSAFVGACMTGQTVYDWTYLSLAIGLSCKMVTADQRFIRAPNMAAMSKNLAWIGDL